MSLSLAPSADGNFVELKLGATVIAKFSTTGVEAGGVLLADDATAQGLSNLKQLITPAGLNAAFKGANQLKSAIGYQKLPGGLIFQWGNATATTTGVVVPLPVAFPTAGLQVIAGGSNDNQVSLNAYLITSTNFTLKSSAAGTFNAAWIAIGF